MGVQKTEFSMLHLDKSCSVGAQISVSIVIVRKNKQDPPMLNIDMRNTAGNPKIVILGHCKLPSTGPSNVESRHEEYRGSPK